VIFFGRKYGICIFRSHGLKENLCWSRVKIETPFVYLSGRRHLESLGYEITSVTLDGKRGVASVFGDIPVQMCLFHQMQIITRYLTKKPKLEASIELKKLSLTLIKTTEDVFEKELKFFGIQKWKGFLNEKTLILKQVENILLTKNLDKLEVVLKNIYLIFLHTKNIQN